MPQNQLTQKEDSFPSDITPNPAPGTGSSYNPSLAGPAPTSRPITQEEIDRMTGREAGPYTPVHEANENVDSSIDYDDPRSWNWPNSNQLRPQKRAYKIIGTDGKPTGKIVFARNEIQGSALRQESRDNKGNIYLPAAELIDVIYES